MVNEESRYAGAGAPRVGGDLENLLAATGIATLFLDRQLRVLRSTPTLSRLFGIGDGDRGRPLAELAHRLPDPELPEEARRVLEEPEPAEREVRDGEDRWYLVRILPLRGREGGVEGVVLTFLEVTDRKEIEEELRKAKDYAEKIVETLHEPLLVLEPDLRIRSANPAFYRHFRVRESETLGRRIWDLGNGQWDIPELHRLLEAVLPEDDVFLDYEVVHEFEEIGRRVMLLNGRRLDHVQLILLGIRDETERRAAEDELREAERRFRTVANLVPDLLWRSRRDGWVTWCNQRWLDYTGQSAEEAAGPGWVDAIHPDERPRAYEVFEEATRSRTRAESEHRLRRHDGAYRWFLLRGDPVLGADGEIEQWFGSATDVQAQREARDLLEERVAERTRDLRAKEAHLVRTAEALQAEIGERRRAEEARDALSRRVLSAEEEERRRLSLELHDQMGQLITGLSLAVRHLEEQPRARPVLGELEEIRRLAERIGEEAHGVALALQPPSLDRLGLRAALEGHLEEWCELHGSACDFQAVGLDDTRFSRLVEITFYRILQEGLTNVAKHAEAEHVGLLLEYRDGVLGLLLEDDGRGFDPDSLEDDVASAHLGLAGMRQRLSLLGGTLKVESSPGAGTTLIARVEARPVEDGAERLRGPGGRRPRTDASPPERAEV